MFVLEIQQNEFRKCHLHNKFTGECLIKKMLFGKWDNGGELFALSWCWYCMIPRFIVFCCVIIKDVTFFFH